MAAEVDYEKPSAAHVQDGHATTMVDSSHGRSIHVVPIEQEALEDAHHVHLSWRSWVWSFTYPVYSRFVHALPQANQTVLCT